MIRQPPRSTRPATLFPTTALFRSDVIGPLTLLGQVVCAAPFLFRRNRGGGLQAPQIVPQADSGTEQDRHDGNMQAVDKAGLEVVAHHAGSAAYPHIAVCDMYGLLQRARLPSDGGHAAPKSGGIITKVSAFVFYIEQ